MTDKCEDIANCGKRFVRDVKCVAPGSNLSLDEKFFCGEGSNAGPKPDETLTCKPCVWQKQLVGQCQYDPSHKSCRPNSARQAYTYVCNAEAGCEGEKPSDGFD